MMQDFNTDISSFLFKGRLPTANGSANVREAEGPKRTDYSQVTAGRADLPGVVQARNPEQQATQQGQPQGAPQQRVQPVRVEKKVGRNEPCPCGSGRKFKQCHGK